MFNTNKKRSGVCSGERLFSPLRRFYVWCVQERRCSETLLFLRPQQQQQQQRLVSVNAEIPPQPASSSSSIHLSISVTVVKSPHLSPDLTTPHWDVVVEQRRGFASRCSRTPPRCVFSSVTGRGARRRWMKGTRQIKILIIAGFSWLTLAR